MTTPATLPNTPNAIPGNYLPDMFGTGVGQAEGINDIILNLFNAWSKLGIGASVPTNIDDILYVTSAGATAFGKRGLVKIAEASGTGSSGVLTFSSIPATYRELELVLVGRSDTASTSAGVRVAFNGDATAANYLEQLMQAFSTTVSASEAIGANGFFSALSVAAASSTANVYGAARILLPEYANTSIFKPVEMRQFGAASSASSFVPAKLIVGEYKSTSAIASITVTLAAGNWTTLSRATLWGKAA